MKELCTLHLFLVSALLLAGALACGPAAPYHEEQERASGTQESVELASPPPAPASAQTSILSPQQEPATPKPSVGEFLGSTSTPAASMKLEVVPTETEETTITAQSDDSNSDSDSEDESTEEPPPTLWPSPYPTAVGADSEKYPNMKGLVRTWALAIDETREQQQAEGSSGESDDPIVPNEATLESKGGVITAVVVVHGGVVNAKVKIIQWLEDNGLEYYDHGGRFSVQFNAAQLSKMGPLSQLDAVYEVRDPIRVYSTEGLFPREGYASEDGTGPPGPPRPSDGN